jgi:DNA recombination protein RmuC
MNVTFLTLVCLAVIIIVLLIIILIKQFNNKSIDISPQILDLDNQINDLKTKQLEHQTTSLSAQQTQLTNILNQINDLKTKQLEHQSDALSKQQKLLIGTQTTINEQLGGIRKEVKEAMSSNQGVITQHLNRSSNIIGEIQEKLGSLDITTKNIQDISKDISSLQEILQAPKLRGNLGEYLLEELLKDILPSNNYEMKYSLKNGMQVDAVIKLGEGMVFIDSKFPLESFQRLVKSETEEDKIRYKKEFIGAVKNKINEIATKYIDIEENTFEFAMMYIPAENVFYETVINDSLKNKGYELFKYAIEKRIILVSPNSFYAYLISIVYGLKGLKIEQEAKIIKEKLSAVKDSFGKFYTDFNILGKHIGNVKSKYNDLDLKAKKFNEDVKQITGVKDNLIEDVVIDI